MSESVVKLADAPKKNLTVEYGQGGVTYFDGFISNDEFNTKLTFPNGVLTYDKMRRTDAQVQALLYAVTLPILSADWEIEGDDEEQKEFVRVNCFEKTNWSEFLKHITTSLWAGFSWAEKVYEVETYKGEEKMMLKKLAARLATSVERWETDDQEELQNIVQQIDNGKGDASKEVPIPYPSKAVLFSFQKEANNYEGQSILRSAYKHWFIKDQIYHIDAIRIERFALGMPHIKLPEDFDNEGLNSLIEMGKNWKAGSQSYIITPAGVDIEIMTVAQGSVLDVLPTINHHNEEIGKSGLAQFINFGRGGNRALGETAQEFFFDALKNVAQWISTEYTNQVIKPLLRLNYANPSNAHMRASNIGAVALPQLIRFLREVGEVFVQPDKAIEDKLRDQFGLPARTEETPEPLSIRTEKKDNQALEQGQKALEQADQNMEMQKAISNNPGEYRGGGPKPRTNSAANRPLDNRSRTGSRTVKDEDRKVQRFLDEVESGKFNDSPEWPSWVYRAVATLADE
jgi:hypothetical protein